MNNVTILQDFMQKVWNEKDPDAVERFVDDEYSIHLDTGDPWEGKTLDHVEYKKRLLYSFDSFPDIHFAIQSAIADGNYVAITWLMTGTNLGKIGEYSATGRTIKTQGATIYHFRNGKVCGHNQVFDRTKVIKQLGFA